MTAMTSRWAVTARAAGRSWSPGATPGSGCPRRPSSPAAAGGSTSPAARPRRAGGRRRRDQGGSRARQDVWLLPLDLASLASVRACAAAFLALDEPLHVLVNNAGLGGQRGLTADGFELHFGVNHLGHYALTLLLLDRLTASGPDARIVNVSSEAHYGAPRDRLRRAPAAHRRRSPASASTRSRSCATCCSRRSWRGGWPERASRAYALHPGVVASDIWRRVPRLARPLITARMLTTEQGAVTSLYCATSPAVAAERRPLLRPVRGPGTEPGRHPGAGGAAVAAQRHLGRGWLNAFGQRASVTGWGYGPSGDAARGPDAGQAGGRDPGRRLHLRAQVGRVPVDRVPRRRRGGDRQQERAADDPLLPRAGDRLPVPAAAPVRHRRRDRAAGLGQPGGWTSRRCSCGCTRPRAGCGCWQRRRRPTSSRSTCWRWATADYTEMPFGERRGRARGGAGRRRRRPFT